MGYLSARNMVMNHEDYKELRDSGVSAEEIRNAAVEAAIYQQETGSLYNPIQDMTYDNYVAVEKSGGDFNTLKNLALENARIQQSLAPTAGPTGGPVSFGNAVPVGGPSKHSSSSRMGSEWNTGVKSLAQETAAKQFGMSIGVNALSGLWGGVSGLSDAAAASLGESLVHNEGAFARNRFVTGLDLVKDYADELKSIWRDYNPDSGELFGNIRDTIGATGKQLAQQANRGILRNDYVYRAKSAFADLLGRHILPKVTGEQDVEKNAEWVTDKAYNLNDRLEQELSQYGVLKYINEENVQRAMEGTTGAAQVAGRVSNVVATMLPSIFASAVSKDPNLGLAMMAVNAGGQAADQAYKNGASSDQAYLIGAQKGFVEFMTERMFDAVGVFGGGKMTAKLRDIIGDFALTKTGRVLTRAANLLGENVEEGAADYFAPIIDKAVLGETQGGEEEKSLYQAMLGQMPWTEEGVVTLLSSLILGAGSSVVRDGIITVPKEQAEELIAIAKNSGNQRLIELAEDYNRILEHRGKLGAGKYSTLYEATRERAGEDFDRQIKAASVKAEHAQTGEKKEKLVTNIGDFLRSNIKTSKGEQIPEAMAQQIASEYDMNPDTDSATFAFAAREAFQYGEHGYSLDEAKAAASFAEDLTEDSFRNIWKLGALDRVGGENKSAGQLKNEVRAYLAPLGEETANRLADLHDGTTDANEYAKIVNKALFYTTHKSDLQTVVEEIRNGLKTTWAQQDHELTKLTPEQITAIQELGPKIAAQRAAEVQRQDARLTQISEAAQGVTALKQVNRQLSAARGVLAKAEVNLKEAEAEMRQMQDSGAWSTQEEAYNEVVRRVERLDNIIEKGKKVVQELEAKRAEAQNREPIKRKQGTVSFDESVDRENLTRDQKKVVAFVEALADAVNIDYVLYAGKDTQGGLYKDGMLHININAALKITKDGKVESRSVAGAILSHELTHYLQQYAPKEYEALRDFVIEKIRAEKGERGFSKLVQDQIDMERSVKKLSYDQAVDELVANSCITMLADSQTVKELARKNMTLAEKIADFLTDFAEKIRAVFEGVDIHDDSGLYDAARAMEKYFGEMQKMWDAALKSADVNYNAAQAAGETAGGAEQAMAWDQEDISRTFVPFTDINARKQMEESKMQSLIARGKTVTIPKAAINELGKRTDWSDLKKAREGIKSVLKAALGDTSVYFRYDGGTLTAYLTKEGRNHSAGGLADLRRGAIFTYVGQLIEQSEYIYSSEQDVHNQQTKRESRKTEWDSFEAVADIDNEYVPIIFSVKTNERDVRSRIHAIFENRESALPHDPGLNTQGGMSNYEDTTLDPKIAEIISAVKENNLPAISESEVQAMAWEGPEPEKTQYGFKLMNVDEDGLPHAMFVDAAKPYELGKWYAAEAPGLDAMLQQEPGYVYLMDEDNNVLDRRPISRRPKGGIKGLPSKSAVNQATKEGRRWMTVTLDAKGKKAVATVGINGSEGVSTFALRPGLHAVDIPSMDHIGAKSKGSDVIDTRRPNQRWFLIEYPVDQDYNQEAYSNPRKDIRDHLPTRGWYSFQTNSGAEANQHWFITGGMRIVGAVSEADARKYARDHGFKEDLPWKLGKSYSDDDAMDLAEYIRTAKAQPTPSKEEMKRRITEGAQFMMLEPVEETDRLVAVHNKSVSGLRRMLQRGGVPYPSIAIKKAGTPHEGFGDVSIVFPRSSIDPKVNRQNRIYSNDAWTPTEPVKEYDVGNTYRYSKKLRAQVGDAAFNGLYGPSTLEESEMAKLLQYSQGKIAEALKGKPIFKYAYLDSIGKTPQVGTTEKVLDNFGTYKNSQLLAIFEGMPDYDFENLDYSDEEALERIAEILQGQFESTLTPEQAERVRKHPLYTAEKVRPVQIRDAYRRYKNSGMSVEMIPDYSALDRDLRGNVELEKDEGYIRWLEETFKDLIVDEGIRNDKDLFTSSGNRRSFKSLHIPATLDNIVKLMQKQQERGNGLVGINLRGAATKSYNTVEEARAERGRLLGTHIADDVYDSYMKGFYERLHGIVEKVSPSDRIESWDSTEEILLEAVRDTNSLAAMTRKLNADKRWLKGDLEAAAKDLWQLKNDVQNMPAPYFEAKPRRIVYPGEALAYILPDNADEDVVKMLKNIGYDPVFYKAGDNEDRLAKLNSIDGAQFMTWGDQVSFEDLMDENAQMSMDDLEDETLPGEGFEEWRRNESAAAKTMPGMEKVPAQQGPRRERALAAAITQQTKKLLEGYTPTDWDRSITAEDIDGWLDADEYHGVMGSMFDDGMQAADLLYDLAQAQPEKAEDAYLVMEQLTRTMNPLYAQAYTVPGGYDRTPGFTEWYMKRNPSVYYPGYKPGDLFADTLFGEGNTTKEIEYLNELLSRPEVSPEKKAEAQAFLDRLTRKPEEWSVRAGDEIRDYKEVFYMSWDNDHNDWAPEFYSKLNRTVAEWTNDKGRPMPEKMGAGAVIPWLRGRGVKAEEIRWSGLQPWLEGRKSVTQNELAAYLSGNMVDIRTEVRGMTAAEYQYDIWYNPFGIEEEHFKDDDDLMKAVDKIEAALSEREGHEVYVKPEFTDEAVIFYYEKPDGEKEHVLRATINYPTKNTKWDDYTMKGGANYREILFTLPGSNYDNTSMRTHWERPGVIAHARVQDMDSADGKSVLFIEEIQSDWHNAGAKKNRETKKAVGFNENVDTEAIDRIAELNRERGRIQFEGPSFEDIRSLMYSLQDRIYMADKEHQYSFRITSGTIESWLMRGDDIANDFFLPDEESKRMKNEAEELALSLMTEKEKELLRQARETYAEVKRLGAEEQELRNKLDSRPPEIPFAGSSDTYHEYVMKHLLRIAAEGGYDAIAWTTAEQQAERWWNPEEDEMSQAKKSYEIEYDQIIPSFMKKYTKQWGGKVEDLRIKTDHSDDAWWDADLEGADISPEGTETVHGVSMTPEMKKAVLHEGQPLFMSWDGMEDTEQEWQARLEAYSRLEAEQAIQDQVFQSIRELTRSQKKSLAEIQKRLKIGKTPEARMDDVQRMARSLMSRYNSTLKEEDVIGEIAAIWNYVLQDQDPSGNVVRNMAEELAEKIVDSAEVEVIDETEEETLKEIRNRIRGQKLVIGADETGDIPGYANLAEFRKKNFGRFSVAGRNSDAVTDQHVPVDSLYEELRNSYGDYYFPESTSQGEMLGVLSGYFDATERQTANPFADSYGEAVEAIAGEITRSAWWDAVRLTPLTEAEQAKVRNAEGREIIQNLRGDRKITKGQAEKLEAPMAAEEQLIEQTRALKAQIREMVEAGEMSKAEAAELQASLLKMTRRVNTLEEQYRLLEEAADKRVAQIREEGAAKVAEAIAKQQEKAAKNVQALKDHFKEVQQNARARREESGNVKKYRDQVTKKAKKLFELLMTNSDQKHVPEILKGPLAQFLTELDFTSKRQLRGGDETKNDRAFAANLQRLEQVLSNQQAYISGDPNVYSDLGGYIDVSPDNLEYLRQVSELITKALMRGETFTINSMTGAQLKDLSKLLSNLYTAINRMNDFMANARYKTVREAAAGDIGYFNSLGKADEKAEGLVNRMIYWKDGVPYYVFNRFGEGGKSIFDGFTRGWERLAFRAQEIINFTEALYTDKEVAEWSKDLHEFTLEDGSKIRMTTAQVMELSMLLNREQAVKHIMKGGIRIGTVRLKNRPVNDTDHYHLTQGDITNITGSLTSRQVEVAKALQRFMAEKGAEWGNEISMRRFGYNFYTEGENYYPIRTDPSDRPMSDTDLPQNASMFRLLNLSSSKALNPKASNALIVGDIFDTFANHTSDMAKLNAMGLPVLDAIKWFNYKERIDINQETGEHTTRTLQRAMERAYGTQAGHYFRTLMKDINGVVEAGDRGADVWSNLTARYKAVAVGANLRVALLQPTSYLRALNVIDGKYLAAAFAHRNAYKEAMQYSGTAVWKSMGYYDTDISKGMRGQIKHDDTWKDKVVEASMKAAEIGDKRTWGRLWVACKLQTKAQNPELSGEELKQATADLFRKVIYASQVMDSTLTRSEMMRSKSIGDKLLTPFMAEPTLSFNILMDAYSGYALDERRLGRAEAWKKNAGAIGRALTAYIATAAFNALAESIWDAVRDDDDEDFLEKFLQALFGEDNLLEGNLVQDLLISNKIPGVKDVISMLTGYTNRNIATEGIENIINAARIWLETWQLANGTLEKATKVTYYGRMTEWGRIYKSLQALSQVTGLPIYPLTREAVAIWNTLMNGRKDEWKILTYNGNQLKDDQVQAYKEYVEATGLTQTQYKKILDAADVNGSVMPTQDELGEWIMGALADGEITEEQAQALWKSRWNKAGSKTLDKWRENYEATEEKLEETLGMSIDESIQQAEEAVKTEATPEPTPIPTPTPTPTPKLEATPKPAATQKPKPAEKKDDKKVTDRDTFKKYVPVYSDNADTAYDLYESEVKPLGISLEKYSQIIIDANADGKGTSTQDEMGNYLVSQVKANKITQEQADAIWHTIWSKPKSKTFQSWLQKNYNG